MMHAQTSDTKRIPKLRFPEFSGEWEEKRLGEFLIQHTEKTIKNNQYPVLTSSQKGIYFQKDYFAGNDVASKDTTGYNVVPRNYFTYRHMSDNLIFKFNINNIVDRGIVSTLYPVFTTKGINGSFLLLKLNEGKEFKRHAVMQKQGGSRTYMYYSKLKNLKLNLPINDEQQKITSFLSSVSKWIVNLRSQKQELESYKKGMVQKIFSQEIRFKDDRGKEFPEWEEKKMSDLLTERKDRNLKGDLKEVFSVAKNMGVINQIEHLGRSYAATDLRGYKAVHPNDVVYTKSPTSDFPYGIIKQNKTGRVGLVSTLYAVYIPSNMYIGFLLHEYFLSWVNTFNYLNPLVHKGAKNTMNIGNNDFLKGAKIKFPTSPSEQQKIANFCNSLDNLISSKQQHIVQTEQWKKGIMQKMFI